METRKITKISYAVFFLTLGIVVINLVSLLFPALIVTLTSDSGSQIDPFEPGAWAIPFLVTNVVVFYLIIIYYRKNLPNAIANSIKFILNFEVSRKVAAIVIVILLGGYVIFTVQDLNMDEAEEFSDFYRVEKAIEGFPFTDIEKARDFNAPKVYVKNFLLFTSQVVFQNIKVIPFIASISLLLLTYFFTMEISKKRFAGIIAMVILLQSSLFLRYDTVATYSYFWTLFYVLSLYLLYKKWVISPVAYFLSIFSKPLTALFLPLTLFFIYNAEIPRRKKIHITISYVIIIVTMAGVLLAGLEIYGGTFTTFNYVDFWSSFTVWAFQLRFDWLMLLFLLPLTVGLFLVSRKGIPVADSVLVLIMGTLLSAPLLASFTDFGLHPYRFIPLVVFFAIGVGTLLSKKTK